MAAATLPALTATTDDATPHPTAPHYPAALKDRAFDLYSHGFRSPAIAAQLGVPERTVRNWLQTTIQQLAQDDATANPEIIRQQRALAIESQRAVAATAWTAYQQLNDAYTHLMTRALAPTNSQPERLLASINRLAATAARHLAVVISANREIARLQGQAIHEHYTATQQAAADAADLLRVLTMPIPTPTARPSALDTLPPIHNTPATHTPTSNNLPPVHNIPTPGIPSTEGLPVPDVPPLPDHIIAAVMNHYRKMYPDDPDSTARPIAASPAASPLPAPARGQGERSVAPPSLPSPHGPFPWREGGRGLGKISLPRTGERLGDNAHMPSKTKIAAKTATPPRQKNNPNHQPAIAIPSRIARKLKKVAPHGTSPHVHSGMHHGNVPPASCLTDIDGI